MTSRRIAIGATCLAGFAALALGEAMTEALPRLDLAVNAFFAPWRREPFLAVFLWLTILGTGAALLGVMLATSGLLWAHGRSFLLVPLWTSYLGAEATTWGAKFLVGRQRPAFIEAASAASPSFPSAHSAGVMLVWGFLAYLVASEPPARRHRGAAVAAASVLILLVSFSRIFLSVHYLGDVAGGLLLAAFWLALGVEWAERVRRRAAAPGGSPVLP